jgi:hypothetical protein
MQEQIADVIRSFRDIPNKHVYMSAKLEKSQDEMGRILYAPSMPGNKAGQALPYFFDEVLAIRVEKNTESGELMRVLQTNTDGLWQAKDRSGTLDMWEDMDLGAIITKISTLNDGVAVTAASPVITKKPSAKSKKPAAKPKAKVKDLDFEDDESEDDQDD